LRQLPDTGYVARFVANDRLKRVATGVTDEGTTPGQGLYTFPLEIRFIDVLVGVSPCAAIPSTCNR
jgi:hypothetical protein